MSAKETVLANKEKLSGPDALAVVSKVSEIIAAKGKKITRLKMKDGPSEEEILAAILGPTGNLRAPTLLVGKKALVGFSDEVYDEVFS